MIGTSLLTHSTLSPLYHFLHFSGLLLPPKVGDYSSLRLPEKDIEIDIYSLSPFPFFSLSFPFSFSKEKVQAELHTYTLPSQPVGKAFIPQGLSSDFGGQTTHEKNAQTGRALPGQRADRPENDSRCSTTYIDLR